MTSRLKATGSFATAKRLIKQCFAVSSLNLGQLSIGLGIGYSSILIPQLKESSSSSELSSVKIDISVNETSWIVSLISIGQIGGAIIGAILASAIGRKGAILLSIVPSITGWCVVGISQNVAMLYAGRVLCGLGMGMEGTVHPIYVCELASASYRGPLAASGVIIITTGVLLSYVLGTFISWKLCAWIFLSVHVLLAVLVFIIPESPSWLIHKKLYSRADEALKWLGRDQDEFATEVEMDIQNRMNKVVKHQNGKSYKSDPGKFDKIKIVMGRIFCKQTVVPLIIIVILFLIQNWSGFIVTIMYTVVIFEESKIDIDEFQATILVGCVQVLGTTFGTIILNIVGRRSLLMFSSGLCSLFMGMLGTIFFLKQHEPESVIVTNAGSWLPLACLVGFTFTFTIGLGPVPWVLVGELFPANVRSYCAGLSTCFCYTFIFLANWSYPHMVPEIGHYGVFWVYTAVSALGLLFCIMFVPETKNRSLEEIENHFSECEGWMALFTSIQPLPAAGSGSGPTRDNLENEVSPPHEHLSHL